MAIFKPKKIDLNQTGLAKVLGTLEAKVVEYIWDSNGATAREVCDHINRKQKISFNAVNTVINRLVDKDILSRTKEGSYWQYKATYSKDELYQMVSGNILKSLVQDKEIFGLASFVEAVDKLSENEKDQLRKLLK